MPWFRSCVSALDSIAQERRAAALQNGFDLSQLDKLASPDIEARVVGARSIAELQALMTGGGLSSEQVTAVYVKRSSTLGFPLGAVVDEMYTEALAAARDSDARRRRGDAVGLLEGVPISVKENFTINGADATCGLACKAFKTAAADGLLVSLLRQQGAIPFVRSNVPQGLMLPETDSFVYGRCVSPWSSGRTPGGSSGGEGALLAARCSPLGIGTDIAGSIRIPAAFCGIYGLKPTAGRLSSRGTEAARPSGVDGQNGVLATAGPMGRCVDDLAHVMRCWLVAGMWAADPTVPRMPFDESEYADDRPLRVGYWLSDGFFEPAAACMRAVLEAVEAMRAAGHEVVEFDPRAEGLDTYGAALMLYGLLGADGGMREVKRGLQGERLHPSYSLMNVVASLPRLLRRLVVAAVRLMPRNSRLADVVASFGQRRVDEYWQLVERRILFQRQLVDKWAARRLDILITPGIGIPAFRHGASRDLSPACSHTFLFNLVNFPAGAVPVSRVRPDECSYTCPARQDDMAAAAARREMAGAAGLPVGVQVVGLPLHEERVLRGMRQLEAALRRRSTNTDTAATAAPPAAKSASADTGGRNAAGGGDLLPPAHCGYCPEAVVQATLAQLTRGATRLQ